MRKVVLIVSFVTLLSLAACGAETTVLPVPTRVAQETIIPTFTALPLQLSTPTPTLIVVPDTVQPTFTPVIVPTFTPTRVPTATPHNTPTRVPTATALPATGYHEITVEQARNLNGYRALLPTFLPASYKLNRLSLNETTAPHTINLVAEFGDGQGHLFYITAQALPDATPTPLPTLTPTELPTITPRPPASGTILPTPTLTPTPTPTFTPPFTPTSATFHQESLRVRGQAALLSYTNDQALLSWSDAQTHYFINGALSRDDILHVAESLA